MENPTCVVHSIRSGRRRGWSPTRVLPNPARDDPRLRRLESMSGVEGRHAMKCKNILEAIGHTPLIRLNRITKDIQAQVYVKADYLNPGGSVKDRIGTTMIDAAEKKGLL